MGKPTDAELELLNVLWAQGPSTVRAVHAALGEATAYTTTLKILQNMAGKGLVRRDTSQRSHIYEAAVEAQATQQALVRELAGKAFAGSASKLVMAALSERPSDDELAEIRALLDSLEA